MFNPRLVKDEVDHSFFDSDYEEEEDIGAITKDGGMKGDKDSKGEKGVSPPAAETPRGRETQKTEALEGSRSPPRTDEGTVQSGLHKRVENKRVNYGSEAEDASMASSMSSIGCSSDKAAHTASDMETSSTHSKSPNETFLVWPAKDDDEDGYHQSQDESGEEEEDGLTPPSSHKACGLKAGKVKTPKKFLRKRHSQTSSDTDTDTDSSRGSTTSSSSSSSEGCTPEPPICTTKSRTLAPSTSNRMRRSSVGSAEPRERPPTPPVEESEDSVTDVTPLSTPDTSPLQSLDLTTQAAVEKGPSRAKNTEDRGLQDQQQQPEDDPSSVISRTEEDEEDEASEMDKYSFSVESQLVDELVFTTRPGGRNRKNYSFSNEEVRRIDRENQRLLRKLSARSRPASSAAVRRPMASSAPPIRVNHSGLNRQREQQRIERENLAFLKRLESIKPTPGMRRSEQLDDYQRQASYLGNASVSIYRPATKKQSSSISPSGKGPLRPGSVVHHTRAASSSSDSTSRPKSNKVNVPRPAWS